MDAEKSIPGSTPSSYEPYMHRKVANPTNNLETLVHLIKSCIGTGILAMPQSYVNAGLLLGIIMTIFCGAVITHCLNMFFRIQYILCKRRRVPLLTYSESMIAALEDGPNCLRPFAKCSGALATIFIVLSQLGICCCFIVFISGTLKKIVDPYHDMRIEYHMCIVMIPLLLANLITSLKMLSPFSVLANVLCFGAIGATSILLLKEKPISTEAITMFGSIYTLPLFFGTCIFALTAVGSIIAVERNMAKPAAMVTGWFGLLNICMIIVVSIFVILAIVGYMYCKSKCGTNISLDLPASTLTKIIWVAYAISILFTYILHFFSPIEIFWDLLFKERLKDASNCKKLCNMLALRMSMCIITFLVALVVPNFGLIIALTGALCFAAVALIFPPLMELCVMKDNYGPCNYILLKDIFLFLFGFTGMIVGSATAIFDIIRAFSK